MNIIKLILAAIGLIFVGMLMLWVFGMISTLVWYLFWIGVLGAIGYGAYKLFLRAEARLLGNKPSNEIHAARDYDMSWDEYERKYLSK